MKNVIFVLLVSTAVSGCYSVRPASSYPQQQTMPHYANPQTSQVSYGMAKGSMVAGRTTQAEVLERFGSPTNMTLKANGEEVWIYDQVYSESSTDSSGGQSRVGLNFFGLGDPVVGFTTGAGQYNNKVTTRSALKTLTVILTFDARGVLQDVSARKGGY